MGGDDRSEIIEAAGATQMAAEPDAVANELQ
jgi:hypothetical protein